MKQIETALKELLVDKAKTVAVLKDVTINEDEIGQIIFKKFSTEESFAAYCLLAIERYFIIVKRGSDEVYFECTKEEGNSLYKYVKETREFNFDE